MNNYNSQQQSANYNSQQSANYNLQQQQSSNYNLQQHKFANVPPKQYHQQSRQQQYNNIPHDQHIHINTHPLELEITPKRKFPLVWIVVTAVCVPILIMICMFGAVWMQELGFLR
uniref:Transmembrane protein n=1 Tax=Rhabditophanes sp. KR3021 TaxID=114890 RepID=A0AC35TRN0_9BILA